MKTLLHASIALAASVPLSVAATFAGWSVPAVLSPVTLFSGFVVSSILLVAVADYRPLRSVTRTAATTGSAKPAQAEHPLAA